MATLAAMAALFGSGALGAGAAGAGAAGAGALGAGAGAAGAGALGAGAGAAGAGGLGASAAGASPFLGELAGGVAAPGIAAGAGQGTVAGVPGGFGEWFANTLKDGQWGVATDKFAMNVGKQNKSGFGTDDMTEFMSQLKDMMDSAKSGNKPSADSYRVEDATKSSDNNYGGWKDFAGSGPGMMGGFGASQGQPLNPVTKVEPRRVQGGAFGDAFGGAPMMEGSEGFSSGTQDMLGQQMLRPLQIPMGMEQPGGPQLYPR